MATPLDREVVRYFKLTIPRFSSFSHFPSILLANQSTFCQAHLCLVVTYHMQIIATNPCYEQSASRTPQPSAMSTLSTFFAFWVIIVNSFMFCY